MVENILFIVVVIWIEFIIDEFEFLCIFEVVIIGVLIEDGWLISDVCIIDFLIDDFVLISEVVIMEILIGDNFIIFEDLMFVMFFLMMYKLLKNEVVIREYLIYYIF